MSNPILISTLKFLARAFTKENLNPVKTPSTGVAIVAASTVAALGNSPMDEYNVLTQLVLSVVAVYCFYKQDK